MKKWLSNFLLQSVTVAMFSLGTVIIAAELTVSAGLLCVGAQRAMTGDWEIFHSILIATCLVLFSSEVFRIFCWNSKFGLTKWNQGVGVFTSLAWIAFSVLLLNIIYIGVQYEEPMKYDIVGVFIAVGILVIQLPLLTLHLVLFFKKDIRSIIQSRTSGLSKAT